MRALDLVVDNRRSKAAERAPCRRGILMSPRVCLSGRAEEEATVSGRGAAKQTFSRAKR